MPSSIQQFFLQEICWKWLDFALQIADRQEDLWILMPMIGDLIYRRSVLYHEICEIPYQNLQIGDGVQNILYHTCRSMKIPSPRVPELL